MASERPRSVVAISRLSILADDPASMICTFSVSSMRRMKDSQPGTFWIPSKKKWQRCYNKD